MLFFPRKPNLDALRNAIRVLATVDDADFDITTYGHECGTVGCTAFHIARDPWFIAQGFEMVHTTLSGSAEDPISPYYKGFSGPNALRELFRLAPHTNELLFFTYGCRQTVIERMKDLLPGRS